MKRYFRPEIQAMKAYDLATPPCEVKLNQNESPYDIPSDIKSQVLVQFVQTPWNRYTKPYADAVCEKLSTTIGWPAEGIAVANGSNVLIQALMMCVAVKQTVMTVTPTFSLYRLEAQVLGNEVVEVPLLKDFSFPIDEFLKTMKKKKPQIVFLANPNAPTGNLFSEEDLLKVIQAAPGLVVVDEAYYPFSQATLVSHLKKNKNLVILRTFSKAFALAGVRVGYFLADPAIVGEVRKVLLPYCVNSLSQIVAETLLDQPNMIQKWVGEIVGERDRLFEALSRLPHITPYPSEANFICFRTRAAKKTLQGLLEHGVLVRDISGPSPLRQCLRVSVGRPEENAQFLQALQALNRPS
jgi:histidinol-phosphate aminotransferase